MNSNSISTSEKIRRNKDRIIQSWVKLCERIIPPTARYTESQIVDSLPAFLDKLAEALDPRTQLAQANADNIVAPLHGAERVLFKEYNLKHLMEEYDVLLHVLKNILNESGGYSIQDYEIIVRSLWQAAKEAAVAYTTTVQKNRSTTDRHFQLLVTEVKDYAIFMLDTEGRIASWNEGAHRIKLYEESEVIGKHFSMLYRPEDRHAGRADRNLRVARTEGRINEEWWRMKKDGSLFWANVSITALYENNRLIGFGKVVHDLTEKKIAEEQMSKAREEAEKASALKTTFLANMSHEIRTPLSAILGFTDILKSPETSAEDRQRYIDIIDRNGRALMGLIDDILDISKVEAGKLAIEKVPMDIRTIITDISGLFEARATSKGLKFVTTVKNSVPQKLVSDPVRVRQVLNNIIGNAVKFTDKGEVNVTVEHIEKPNGHFQLKVTVQDTGRGIPKNRRDQLFEVFSQADPSTTRKYGGTGLGLALSRKLARELGGDVILGDCPEEKGCSFIILIENDVESLKSELSIDAALARDYVAPKNEPAAPAEAYQINLKNKKILIVEDSDDIRLLLQKALLPTGAQIEFATNGVEGVENALKKAFDCVVMDVEMPVMDGIEAAKKLRNAGFSKPVLALTEHAMNEDVQKFLQSGFNTYLRKPVDSERLLQLVQKLIH